MFSIEARIGAIREVDGIVASSYHYTLFWTAPYSRVIYWNKFGTPTGFYPRTGGPASISAVWWIDPDRDAKLQQALKDPSLKLEVGTTDDKYWIEFSQREAESSSTARRVQ